MPGVPPDAVDNVKKLLKGIFKRGKKKQDKPADQAPPSSTQTTTAAATPQAPAVPASTNGGAPNTDKPLPPTHPADTLPQSDGQQTATMKSDAQTGPVESSQKLGQEADSQAVSATSATPAATSEPVSAVEQSIPPASPPKNDETVEAPKAAETPANKENVAPQPAAQKVVTASETATTAPAPAPAPAQTNGIAEEVKKLEQPTNGETAVKSEQAKVPSDEEPPSAKAVSNAPGMSATSGPLEDFPEGAVHQ